MELVITLNTEFPFYQHNSLLGMLGCKDCTPTSNLSKNSFCE